MANLNFTLYDFFVDVIPGVLALLLILPLLPAEHNLGYLMNSSFAVGILFLIVGYVLGHFIQGLASWVDGELRLRIVSKLRIERESLRIKYPFEDELNAIRDEGVVGPEFVDLKDSTFDPDLSGSNLFRVIQSYLWDNDIGRMKRFQTLYTFFRSLWVLLIISFSVYLIGAILSFKEIYNAKLAPFQLGALSMLFLIGAIGAYRRRVKFHKEMAKSMIYDFYSHMQS